VSQTAQFRESNTRIFQRKDFHLNGGDSPWQNYNSVRISSGDDKGTQISMPNVGIESATIPYEGRRWYINISSYKSKTV